MIKKANEIVQTDNIKIRMLIAGFPGIGKTTLFKMILGETGVTSGDLQLGVKVYPGYYDQTQENLSAEKTILNEIYL